MTAFESESDFRNLETRRLLLLTRLLTTLSRLATFFFAALIRFRPAFDVADSNFPARYRSVLGLRLAIVLLCLSRPWTPHILPTD